MGKSWSRVLLLTVFLIILTLLVGCSGKSSSKDTIITGGSKTGSQDTFNLDQFQSEMTARGYNYEMQDAIKDFIPTTKKRMLLDKEGINIYLYSSNQEMEKDAACITWDGSYDNGSQGACVDWAYPPHFHKKGTIVINYVGTDERIISDLKDIFGEQFAGEKQNLME